jgi:PAP2 superfamily
MTLWDWGLQHLHPSVQLSATLASVLTVVTLVLRWRWPRAEGARSFAREFAVVMALHGLWAYIGVRIRTHSAGAMHRAEQVQRIESWLHLPTELSLQQAVLPHAWLVQVMNVYYATVHLDGMLVFLIWVWWRHRASFRSVRNTVVATTFVCLLLQMIPVAPPRLLEGAGFVDTALRFGQSVYGPYEGGLPTQLTAMPSVHVAWAFILAWYIATLTRGPWRLVGPVHLVITVLVVAATANHWWLDGIVAVIVTLLVLAGQAVLGRVFPRPTAPADPPAPDLEPAGVVASRPVTSPEPVTSPGPATRPGPASGPRPATVTVTGPATGLRPADRPRPAADSAAPPPPNAGRLPGAI